MKLKKILSLIVVILLTISMSIGSMFGFTAKAEEIVPVTGISITPETLDLQVGSTIQLTANIEPSNATDKNVNWITFDTNIVSVDGKTGIVTGKSAGTASIAAISDDGSFVASCTITVKDAVHVTGITLNPTSKTLKVGDNFTINAIVEPANTTNKSIEWKSYDETIAEVDSNGVVTALKAGTTKIYAISDDNMKLASCDVTIEETVPITGISITPDKSDLEVGSSLQLAAKAVPSGENYSDVTWVTFDTDIVSVDKNTGKVTGLKPGTADIAAVSNNDNLIANCTINVKAANVPVTGISVKPDKTDLTVGKEIQLTATITPTNATNQNVTWVTFDTSIVSVDKATGKVTGLKIGTADIAAVSEDGNYIADCKINVVPEENQDADKAAADAVIAKINSIPDNITPSDKTKVTDARTAYNALTDSAKALVTNLQKLIDAENAISKLEQANNNPVPVQPNNNGSTGNSADSQGNITPSANNKNSTPLVPASKVNLPKTGSSIDSEKLIGIGAILIALGLSSLYLELKRKHIKAS